VYAGDILLLAPSVTALQQLLYACEAELDLLDMTINVNESACMRIGPRYKVKYERIITVDGREILWCDTVKYFGVYLTAVTIFRCTYDYMKRSFYRAFNGIFGKVGRAASEEVVVHLLKAKCIPVLYYGLDSCHINNEQAMSLDNAVHSCIRKIFLNKRPRCCKHCMLYFECSSVLEMVKKRKVHAKVRDVRK